MAREGLYRAKDNSIDFMTAQWMSFHSFERHPAPTKDSLLVKANPTIFNPDLYYDERAALMKPFSFGFSAMEQFRAWFYRDSVLRALKEAGFHLGFYEGMGYIGHTQAVMKTDTMTLVNLEELI